MSLLQEAQDLIDDYVDVVDGDYGYPRPNMAMKAQQLIDEFMREHDARVAQLVKEIEGLRDKWRKEADSYIDLDR